MRGFEIRRFLGEGAATMIALCAIESRRSIMASVITHAGSKIIKHNLILWLKAVNS